MHTFRCSGCFRPWRWSNVCIRPKKACGRACGGSWLPNFLTKYPAAVHMLFWLDRLTVCCFAFALIQLKTCEALHFYPQVAHAVTTRLSVRKGKAEQRLCKVVESPYLGKSNTVVLLLWEKYYCAFHADAAKIVDTTSICIAWAKFSSQHTGRCCKCKHAMYGIYWNNPTEGQYWRSVWSLIQLPYRPKMKSTQVSAGAGACATPYTRRIDALWFMGNCRVW